MSDDDYRAFQLELVLNPSLGALIPGTGGLRKVRIGAKGHGKRGGARVVYYWASSQQQLLMLYVYPKGVQPNLTQDQKKRLKKLVSEWYHETQGF